MRRIICIGNRLTARDAAGPLVYDYLARVNRPPDVELIDGALGGLDLLRFMDRAERVVFVDAMQTCGVRRGIVVLSAAEAGEAASEAYDHAAGLAYLLRVLQHVWRGPCPEVWVVGIEGPPHTEIVEAAGKLCLALAAQGAQAADQHPALACGARP